MESEEYKLKLAQTRADEAAKAISKLLDILPASVVRIEIQLRYDDGMGLCAICGRDGLTVDALNAEDAK